VVDEAVRERGTAERVEARADDRADLREIEIERVDRVDRTAEQLVLDLRRTTLQAQLEQVVAELQRPALDAAAGEDALRELVVVELQAVERVGLVELARLVADRQGGDPRAFAGRSRATCDDRSRERGGPAGLRVGSDVEAPDWCPFWGAGRPRAGSKEGAAPAIDDIQRNTSNRLVEAVLIEFFAAVEADLMR